MSWRIWSSKTGIVWSQIHSDAKLLTYVGLNIWKFTSNIKLETVKLLLFWMFNFVKATPSGGFMRVSCTLNRVPCHHFRWCGIRLMRREMKWVSSRWNHVCTVTNIWWGLELNGMRAYEISNMKLCIVGWVSSMVSFVFWWCNTLETNKMKPSIGIERSWGRWGKVWADLWPG